MSKRRIEEAVYDSDYVEEREAKHHQLRWVIRTEIGGVVREQEFAHPLAAQDALVIAGEHRASGVAPPETLRRLRMLAYESLEAAKQLTTGELEELRTIHRRLEERDQHHRAARLRWDRLLEQRTKRRRNDLRPPRRGEGTGAPESDDANGDAAEDADFPEDREEQQ
jgi:hypothetical protein